MVKFDSNSQVDDSNKSRPLAATFFKENKHLKEHFFAVNEFKESKNGEWYVANATKHFTILIHSKSRQFEALQKLLEHCYDSETAVICRFSADTKSGVVFGEDEEITVKWEDSEDWDYRYHFITVNHYSSLPPLPSTVSEPEQPKQRTRRRKAQ